MYLPAGAAAWSSHVDESGALVLGHIVRTDNSQQVFWTACTTHKNELHFRRLELEALLGDVAALTVKMGDEHVGAVVSLHCFL